MKKEIAFSKMSAAGNDFVLIDNRKKAVAKELKRFARRICDRKDGVGADGMILVEASKKADFKMRIFNRDGSEAEMCGNGARACAQFAYDNRIAGGSMTFQTLAGMIEARVMKDGVSLKMVSPKNIRTGIAIAAHGEKHEFQSVDTGVPHAVLFLSKLDDIDVDKCGCAVRHHKEFSPRGTNVNFARVIDKHTIEVRTYERGVEAETLACGTGSTASAILAAELKGCASPVNVRVRSGDILTISFKKAGSGQYEDVFLKGPAVETFKGTLSRK
ncbi:MAG TPA: diaminopimelate epimerase [bacterium]|nr:diaminopimelate epimerase [bacterium]